MNIPVNRPASFPETPVYLRRCYDENWYSSEGPLVTEFEHRFADFLNVPYATATNSGTTALHLAIACLGIGPGDEVILPALTIASCYFAVWYAGATAVPVDVDPDTYTIDPARIKEAITEKTKAVMVVHLFGHPCDMDPIMELSRKHGLAVIEDAAEAHGALYKQRPAGTIGDIGIFSFYANKIITTGEGGALVTRDPRIYKRAASLKTLNHSPVRFIHRGIGFNYVMSSMQAAVGLASLAHVQESLRYKRAMANLYASSLADIPGLVLPVERPWASCVYWMYAVRIQSGRFGVPRSRTADILKRNYGIQTRTFFYPPKRAFPFTNQFRGSSFPAAERAAREGLYLPSGLGNTEGEFRAVCKALHEIHSA